MKRHLAGFLIAATGAVLLVGLISVSGYAQDVSPRLSVAIATGPLGGTYFPVGEAIAAIVSPPPGVAGCETQDVCEPVGLIAPARTGSGAVDNVRNFDADHADLAAPLHSAAARYYAEVAAAHADERKIRQRGSARPASISAREVSSHLRMAGSWNMRSQ